MKFNWTNGQVDHCRVKSVIIVDDSVISWTKLNMNTDKTNYVGKGFYKKGVILEK